MLLAFVLLAGGGLFSAGAAPIDTGATLLAQLRVEACVGCHAQQHEQWQRSRHAVAWTNGLFQLDYRRQPRPWCQHCHTPLAAQLAGAVPRDQGVGCAACHLRDGVIYARERRPGSPHDTVADAEFGGPAFCAGCHQFAFPRLDPAGRFVAHDVEPMQDTVAQFYANPARPDECRDCHGGGHAFPGSHEPAMLRRALRLAVCRDGDALGLALTNADAGHNVPTGDVHRHVLVQVWYSTAPLALQEAFFGRRFALRDDGGKRTTWDSTIPPGATRRWRVDPGALGEPARVGEPINVALRYVYTDTDRARGLSEPAYLELERLRLTLQELPACAR